MGHSFFYDFKCQIYSAIQTYAWPGYLGYVASKLRSSSPAGGLLPSHTFASRYIYITLIKYFIFRERVHQLYNGRAGRGAAVVVGNTGWLLQKKQKDPTQKQMKTELHVYVAQYANEEEEEEDEEDSLTMTFPYGVDDSVDI
jgi:hypothetical protein